MRHKTQYRRLSSAEREEISRGLAQGENISAVALRLSRFECATPSVTHLEQKVFFVSAKDYVRSGGYNAEENQKLYDLTPTGVGKQIKIYETGGHGADILESHPELTELIKDFIGG